MPRGARGQNPAYRPTRPSPPPDMGVRPCVCVVAHGAAHVGRATCRARPAMAPDLTCEYDAECGKPAAYGVSLWRRALPPCLLGARAVSSRPSGAKRHDGRAGSAGLGVRRRRTARLTRAIAAVTMWG